MTDALRRGRTLDPRGVLLARNKRLTRIAELEVKRHRNPLSLTRKERHELSRIGGTRYPEAEGK